MPPARKRLAMEVRVEALPFRAPFTITGYRFTETPVVVVRLADQDGTGLGEAAGVYYLGDDVARMRAQLEAARPEIEAGIDRVTLRALLPAGGARNALDCALWDLAAKHSGHPAWKLAGLAPPRSLLTTFTLGVDEPPQMAEQARALPEARALKLKLTGSPALEAERVRRVREARPDVWLGVDANQGLGREGLEALMPMLLTCGVRLIEQPVRRGAEAELEGFRSPIPLAADESAIDLADLPTLVGRFQVVNIKLDKCGGLTEGFLMAAEARRLGLSVMVGNMMGSSLAMAPALLLGQQCDVVDLDGPTFLAVDREPAVDYADGSVSYPWRDGWGAAA